MKMTREEVEGKGSQNHTRKLAELQDTVLEKNETIFRLQKTLEEVEGRFQDQLGQARQNLEEALKQAAEVSEAKDQLLEELEALRVRENRQTGTLDELTAEKRGLEEDEGRFWQWLAIETNKIGRKFGVDGLSSEKQGFNTKKKELGHFIKSLEAEIESREADLRLLQSKTVQEKPVSKKSATKNYSESLTNPGANTAPVSSSEGFAGTVKLSGEGDCGREACLRVRESLEVQVRRLRRELVNWGGKNQLLEDENQRMIEIVRQSPKNLTQVDIEMFEQRLINLESNRRRQDQEITQALIGTQPVRPPPDASCGHERLIADLRKSISDKNGCIQRLRSEFAHLLEQIKVLKG
jgi:hypothetical protein